MNDWKNDLLLYWSGEADADTKQRVEALVERDEGARTYLQELRELGEASKDVWGEIPEHRDGILNEVLDDAVRESDLTTESNARSWSWYPTITKIAATIVLIGIAAYFMFRPDTNNRNLVSTERSSNFVVSAENLTDRRIRLSERVLSGSYSFRSNERKWGTLRRDRERREKLRTDQFKS